MGPTAAELVGFLTPDHVSTWAEVPAADLAVCHAGYGSVGGNGLRAIGAEPAADFVLFVDGLMDQGVALSRAAKSSLKLFGRVCRLATGADLTRAQTTAAATLFAIQVAVVAPQPAPAVPAIVGRTGIVKLAEFIDQGNGDEVPTVTDAAMTAALAVYDVRMGEVPTEDFEPPSEQFTGIAHLLGPHSPPYACFSVF